MFSGKWEVWPLPVGISLNLPVTCSAQGYKLFRWFCSLASLLLPSHKLAATGRGIPGGLTSLKPVGVPLFFYPLVLLVVLPSEGKIDLDLLAKIVFWFDSFSFIWFFCVYCAECLHRFFK